jgi:hypothetical protein
MEHRWGERVEIDYPARLLLQDGTSVEGVVRNASISGALIDTGQGLPVFSSLSVVLAIGNGPRPRSIELPACVVRVTRSGLAVEWRDMAVPTLVALLREVA